MWVLWYYDQSVHGDHHSFIIGVFTTETKAREALEEHFEIACASTEYSANDEFLYKDYYCIVKCDVDEV